MSQLSSVAVVISLASTSCSDVNVKTLSMCADTRCINSALCFEKSNVGSVVSTRCKDALFVDDWSLVAGLLAILDANDKLFNLTIFEMISEIRWAIFLAEMESSIVTG